MIRKFSSALMLASMLLFISCQDEGDPDKFKMKFHSIKGFEDWINATGHKAVLKKTYKSKDTDLWVLDIESGEFIIDGEEHICGLFDSKETWEYYPKFIKEIADAGEGTKKPLFKKFYNVICTTVKKE